MAKSLSKGQANVLDALRSLPKRYRYAGGLIKAEYVRVYDGRALNGLIARGLIRWVPVSAEGDFGLRVEEKSR